ncbi:hypothetical protein [Streptomyces sp. NPDC005533]|uniref:hypothetical protein n=1 Tax=Streptomyces sp. NPDC005533 TaxID=3364723 RepID=UPI0036A9A5DC
MPTYEALRRFTTDLDRLTPAQRRRFCRVGLRVGGYDAGHQLPVADGWTRIALRMA